MRVGELAKRTGLSVRTLHYYEEIGLLEPLERTDAGHRRYGEAQLRRLLRIKVMQQLGFSLEAIRQAMREDAPALLSLIEARQRAARQEQRELGALIMRLDALADVLRDARAPSVELLVTAVEAMIMYEKYYTPEQLAQLAERREALGEEAIAAVEASWRALFERLAELKARGVAPSDPALDPLVAQARELFAMFTGGDAQLASSAGQVWRHEGDAMREHGFDPELFAYLGEAQGCR